MLAALVGNTFAHMLGGNSPGQFVSRKVEVFRLVAKSVVAQRGDCMRKRVFALARILLAATLAFLCVGVCSAQFSGNIQGVISDQGGAAIPDASVTLRNIDTGVEVVATTSGSGNFRFNSLPPGHYQVTAILRGFRTTQVTLTLGTSELEGINITLPVASASETVNVLGEVASLDTDDSRIQSTLSAEVTRDLPTLNRNIYDVVSMAPGVVGTGTRGPGESPGGGADNFGTQTPQISANGRSYTGNRVLVDGMDATSNIQNGNIIFAPPPDAVQEVSLQTNSWDAENNLGSSVLVQITTKSGTNQFHGSGSYLFTNQDLSAAGEFANPSVPKNPFKRHDLVGTFGGPIIKDKTFFFADVEMLRSASSTANSVQTFEAPEFVAWAQQNFANGIGTGLFTQYPLTSVSVTGVNQTALQYFGTDAGGAPLCGTAATFNIPCSLPITDTGNQRSSPPYNGLLYNFRGDHYFSPRDRVYVSYANDSFTQNSDSPRKGLSVMNVMNNWYVQGNYTHTFTPTLLNEMSFAANKVGGSNGLGGDFRVPIINVTGQSVGFAGGGWGPGTYEGRNYNWRDVLSWVRGRHTLKFGFNGSHAIEDGDFTPVNNRPTFQFNNLLALVQDQPFSETGVAYNPLTGKAASVIFGGQTTPFGFFAGDDWKVKPNLSLTLALRWDDFGNHTPWGDSGFGFSSLILGSGSAFVQQVASASVQPVSGVFAHPMDNLWSPRIGFAWDPSRRGTWSVRGGVGVYHDWVTLGQTVDQTRNNPPGVVTPSFSQQTAIQPVFGLSTTGTPPYNYPLPAIPTTGLDAQGGLIGVQSAVTSLARNLAAPYAVNYVIGVEHQLPWKLVVGANYSGSRGYDQLTGTDVNRFAGDLIANGGQLTRLNPSFGSIDYVHNGNSTTYNAMILSVRRTAGTWATFQGSYTLSHAKDYGEAGTRFDQDGGINIPDQNAYNTYLADANWDVRNRVSISGVFKLPGVKQGWAKPLTSGWELSSLNAIQTGTPFWVIDNRPFSAGGDYNADGLNYDIPNTPSINFGGSHSRQSYIHGLFTAVDFPAPTPGTEGNLKRNSYRNPGMLEMDASVLKDTRLPWLGERGGLQLRFDFLNVINRVNLNGVDAFLGDGSFGKSTSTLPPRQIQLGARIYF